MTVEGAETGGWGKHGQMLYTTIVAPVIAGILLMVIQYHSPYFEKHAEKPEQDAAPKKAGGEDKAPVAEQASKPSPVPAPTPPPSLKPPVTLPDGLLGISPLLPGGITPGSKAKRVVDESSVGSRLADRFKTERPSVAETSKIILGFAPKLERSVENGWTTEVVDVEVHPQGDDGPPLKLKRWPGPFGTGSDPLEYKAWLDFCTRNKGRAIVIGGWLERYKAGDPEPLMPSSSRIVVKEQLARYVISGKATVDAQGTGVEMAEITSIKSIGELLKPK